MTPAEPLLDRIRAVFTEQGVEFDRPDPERTVLRAPFDGYDLWVRTDEEHTHVTAYAVLGSDVPADRVPRVHELAARLNKDMAVGSFEVDPDRGFLSCKAGIDLGGDELTVTLLRQLVGTVLVAADHALPALRGVLG